MACPVCGADRMLRLRRRGLRQRLLGWLTNRRQFCCAACGWVGWGPRPADDDEPPPPAPAMLPHRQAIDQGDLARAVEAARDRSPAEPSVAAPDVQRGSED